MNCNIYLFKKQISILSITLMFNCIVGYSQTQEKSDELNYNCDKNLKIETSDRFTYKKRGNRCEGFYKTKVSIPSLDIIGLIQGFFSYRMDENEVIKVSSKVNDSGYKLHIQANSIPLKKYYQMDCIIETTDTLYWPLNDVIYPKQIDDKDLIIIGRLVNKNDTILTPLQANPERTNIIHDTVVRVFARSSIDLSYIYYKYMQNNTESQWIKINTTGLAGDPIIIELEADIKGWVSLIISGKIKGIKDKWVTSKVSMYIP